MRLLLFSSWAVDSGWQLLILSNHLGLSQLPLPAISSSTVVDRWPLQVGAAGGNVTSSEPGQLHPLGQQGILGVPISIFAQQRVSFTLSELQAAESGGEGFRWVWLFLVVGVSLGSVFHGHWFIHTALYARASQGCPGQAPCFHTPHGSPIHTYDPAGWSQVACQHRWPGGD